jgi:hypothetical protein
MFALSAAVKGRISIKNQIRKILMSISRRTTKCGIISFIYLTF